MKVTLTGTLALISLMLLLGACGGAPSGSPVDAVQDYLRAKVDANIDKLRPLLCAAMEGSLDREAQSYKGAKAQIKDMACTQNGTASPVTVTCTGTIEVAYAAEQVVFQLGTYRVVQEDGRWKWCGESQKP